MKRINLIIIISILLCALALSLQIFTAQNSFAESVQYARIVSPNAYFYASPSDEDKKFILPETYFVILTAKEVSGYFPCKYFDLSGYVLKSDLKFVEGTPLTPFANASFRSFAQSGLSIRSSPRESDGISNKLTTIPYLETSIQYFGSIEGEEVIAFKGRTWLFCKYTTTAQNTVYGYVYEGLTDLKTTVQKNLEEVTYIDSPVFNNPQKDSKSSSGEIMGSMSTVQQLAMLAGLLVPAVLIIWLIFKPSNIATAKPKEKSKDRKQKARLDYYELD